jgi:hypothetical protein
MQESVQKVASVSNFNLEVPLAWENFAKAESPENILNFLDRVYPNEES